MTCEAAEKGMPTEMSWVVLGYTELQLPGCEGDVGDGTKLVLHYLKT